MTDRQLKGLYFPAWNKAARAHGWTRKGAVREPFFGTPLVNPLYQRIWDIALEKASARSRGLPHNGPSGEEFRHACHCVAFGIDKSASALTNGELDRVLALFRLLADPDDLRASLAWHNPQEEQRRRLVWWIRHHCNPGYVTALCREKFDCADWETLNLPDLRQLHLTLKNRPAAQEHLAEAELAAAAINDNEPF